MIFLTPTMGKSREVMRHPNLGVIVTPNSDKRENLSRFHWWCADNGCFSARRRFDGDRYIYWLMSLKHYQDNCLFAVAPDVVGNHEATWARRDWLGCLRSMGFRAALVAQDGWGHPRVNWDLFDVLFIGGTDDFKNSHIAVKAIKEARDWGKWVHVGRVNSVSRLKHFTRIGANSADGTTLVYNPENLTRIERWLSTLHVTED